MTARINPDQTPQPIFVLSERYMRISVPFHAHRRAQLIHVSHGTLTVATKEHQWSIPPQRGVWIAPGREHRISASTPFTLTTCYIEPAHFGARQQGLVTVDPLTRALLPEVANLGPDWSTAKARRLVDVLFDRLGDLPDPKAGLPISSGESLARLTKLLLQDPSVQDPLSALAHRAGLSERTAARLFKSEFGMPFGAWRRQLRLQTALALLGAEVPVTQTAFDVGYKDVSSFITAFRTEYGMSPGQMFRQKT